MFILNWIMLMKKKSMNLNKKNPVNLAILTIKLKSNKQLYQHKISNYKQLINKMINLFS